jgi:hypothetical protein
MELKKIYYRVGIHKLMESLFNTFIIYSNLKLQIDNPLGVLLGLEKQWGMSRGLSSSSIIHYMWVFVSPTNLIINFKKLCVEDI